MPWHLIAYDIRDPRRLQRVQRYVAKNAVPLQYSVYLFKGHNSALNHFLSELDPLLNQQVDDLRCYPIPHPNSLWQYGHQLSPDLVTGKPPGLMKKTWKNPIKTIRGWLHGV